MITLIDMQIFIVQWNLSQSIHVSAIACWA